MPDREQLESPEFKECQFQRQVIGNWDATVLLAYVSMVAYLYIYILYIHFFEKW